jgi:hypothetical protein
MQRAKIHQQRARKPEIPDWWTRTGVQVITTGGVTMQGSAQAQEVETAFTAQDDADTAAVTEFATALSVVAQAPPEASPAALVANHVPTPASRGRLRRRFERFRGDADAIREAGSSGQDVDQELTVMLLREENARLKAERHRPTDVGVMVDRLRVVATDEGEGNAHDDVWGLLSECLAIREGLDHACDEIHAAISSVQERLIGLQLRSGHPAAGPLPVAMPEPPAAARTEEPAPATGRPFLSSVMDQAGAIV